ncbi:FAD-dependent oxidoreductase [Ferrimonas balearica]|uniref:FAD-dependent oxidoreductase n=1 Tax=Ferrimonas balearica TaxID=44012 RepID=UPI001C99A429|nr:NAD(P)/FAD-dependent oxidoreductase [Ferrimonas balearica]MBY5990894.1 FAD-dependent monooxygenase [Ferrimonas balearica]
MNTPEQTHIAIAGAGPVGALLAVVLAKRGYQVSLYEGRPDSRTTNLYEGRSINLALSERGWLALERVGLAQAIRAEAIPMHQRVMHAVDGSLTHQPYGAPGQAIYSVSRAGINQALISLAEREDNVHLHFQHRLIDVDFDSATARFATPSGQATVTPDYLFGADGANSKVRRLMQERPRMSYALETMDVAYIELNISANADGSHKLDTVEALHIWPRDNLMLIALPNTDGSFTCTLFMDHDDFLALDSEAKVGAFFAEQFPDVVDVLDTPVAHFMARKPSPLALVDVWPWSQNAKVGLIGDACHAIVPFYGQGMNAGFEDCRVLDELIGQYDGDWQAIFPAFEQTRKADVAAIATLAKRNYQEMSSLTGKADFLLRKRIEAKFSQRHPELWVPLYTMVTFRPDIPYSVALRVGEEQAALMDSVMAIEQIETRWDSEAVMDVMLSLARAQWGDNPFKD